MPHSPLGITYIHSTMMRLSLSGLSQIRHSSCKAGYHGFRFDLPSFRLRFCSFLAQQHGRKFLCSVSSPEEAAETGTPVRGIALVCPRILPGCRSSMCTLGVCLGPSPMQVLVHGQIHNG